MKISFKNQFITVLWVLGLFVFVRPGGSKLVYADEGRVGEIRYSILTIEQFQNLYGPDWVLMDGRDITNTDLFPLWGQQNMPDARGVYLRANNNYRDHAAGNPTPNLALGTYQCDEFKSHTHTDKGHSHAYDMYIVTSHGEGGGAAGRGSSGGDQRQHFEGGIKTGQADIQPTGGGETRPRSVIVNVFIKINDPNRNRQTQSSSSSTQSAAAPQEMENNPAFRQAVKNIVTEMMNH